MMVSLLDASSNDSDPGKMIPQTSLFIEAFVSQIESLASADAGDLAGLLNTIKQDASTWYNKIYPSYLEMPSLLVGMQGKIDDELKILLGLSEQLPTVGVAELQPAIAAAVNSLQKSMQVIVDEVNGLGNMLQMFEAKLQADLIPLEAESSKLQQEMHDANSFIRPISDQLAHLLLKRQFISTLHDDMTGIAQCTNYLSNYWLEVGGDAKNCVAKLEHLLSAPEQITNSMLSETQRNWSALIQTWQIASQQLSLPKVNPG